MKTILVVAAILLARTVHAEKIQLGEDRFVNLGVLLQAQLTAIEDAAPNGDVGTDIFIRRGRLILTGQFDPRISFVFITDQANLGRDGVGVPPFIIQDAAVALTLGRELTISAGLLELPFLRHNLISAGQLNAVDFRLGVIKFPAAIAFRDPGLELRGHLANDQIYYRVGMFDGVTGKAATDTTPAINPRDAPRFTGRVQLNIMGKDEGYVFPGITFATTPQINVGAAVDVQANGLGNEATPGSNRYLALALDFFVDYPLDPDNEVVVEGAVLRYDQYGAGAALLPDEAWAFYLQAGYRFWQFEPVASVEYFNGDLDGSDVTTYRIGFNYWLSKHNYNVKAEVAFPQLERAVGGPPVSENIAGTLQGQVVF